MIHKYILRAFTHYSIPRELEVKSTLLATTRLIIIILVWAAYLGSLDFNLKNVYQRSCKVDGSVTIKLKGQLSTDDVPLSDFVVPNPELYRRTYDSTDLIRPPYGDSSGTFVAVTNIFITPNQTRGICPDSRRSETSKCSQNKECLKGQKTIEGVQNGACDQTHKTCLLSSWCPIFEDVLPLKNHIPLLEGVANFTLLIKNSVGFPECENEEGDNQHHYRNIVDQPTSTDYLTKCLHKIGEDDLCPIFRLGDVVDWSGHNFTEVAVSGGIFQIEVIWNCDFDWGGKPCLPKYKFARINDHQAGILPGFSIREPFYHEENRRTLFKMYGIRFIIVVSGEGKKFDSLQLAMAFGATIALFDLAPVICDTLFHFLCHLKRFPLFRKCFGDFSSKSRYFDALYKDTKGSPKTTETSS